MEMAREFHGETISAALSMASNVLGLKKEDLVFEVVDRGSRGFLGAGQREARIKVKIGERIREEHRPIPAETEETKRVPPSKELGSVKEIVDLTADEALDSAQVFLSRRGYRLVQRSDTFLSVRRFRPERSFGSKVVGLLVRALPQAEGGVQLTVEGDDIDGLARWRDDWTDWAESLPKKESEKQPARSGEENLPADPTVSQEFKQRSQGSGTTPMSSTPDLEKSNETGEERVKPLSSELESERALRVESEQRARELQAELDEERARRLVLEGAVGPPDSELYDREGYEERIAVLSSELEDERKRKNQTEEWASKLQSRLTESEAEKGPLREALSTEREKVRHLEADKRLLDDVRRLLGSIEAEGPTEPYKSMPSENVTEGDNEKDSETLILATPSGQVSFLPPFPLDTEEKELLRLIAGEGELTADQIRKQAGRRRAHAAFEDLLERLADEDMHLIVEVSEDRYSFDPAALQND